MPQKSATQLVARDPELEAVSNILQLLEGCAAAGLQHRGLLETAAVALAVRMETQE